MGILSLPADRPGEFVVRYNQHLPQGFRVLRAERVADRTPALMRAINAASWSVLLRGQGTEEISKRLEWLQGVDSFVVKRETNKGSREIDVRPFLYAVVGVQTVDTGTVIQCYSGLGNEANLRMNELGELLGFDRSAVITRTGQFKGGDHYYSPWESRLGMEKKL